MITLSAKTHYFIVLVFLFLAKQATAASYCNNTPRNFILRPDVQFSNLDTPADASSYPPDIRKAIYTTNAIESLNSVIRAAIKKRKVFPTDDSVRKVIYLAIKDASKKWSMPIQNWRLAMSRFIIEFGDRLSDHL